MNLLERIKAGFSAGSEAAPDPAHNLEVAAAVLLLEMRHADHQHSDLERAEIRAQLQSYFKLDEGEVEELLDAAEPAQRQAVSLHSYLQALNATMDVAAKRRVLEMLWRVAYADAHLDSHEEHLLRHLSELLHLPHREFIQAKLAVREERDS